MEAEANGSENVIHSIHDTLQQEIDDTQRELREIGMMLDQSQLEVKKLSERNATITTRAMRSSLMMILIRR